MISRRAKATYVENQDFLLTCLVRATTDPFCSEKNAKGYINLGTAVNQLCTNILTERLNQPGLFDHNEELQHYQPVYGVDSLLGSLEKFLTKRIAKGQQICRDNLRIVNGVTAGLEAIAWSLCDPGDTILIHIPTYSRFFSDMMERTGAIVQGIQMKRNEQTGQEFSCNLEELEKEIIERNARGERVRMMMFCNPQNPLGIVYSREEVLGLIDICCRHNVHFVADEIYALSVHSQQCDGFPSVLQFSPEEIPNPELVHFLWGMSKDFGMAGFRMGVVHSRNQDFLDALNGMAIFVSVSGHVQQAVGNLLKDDVWLDTVYFPENIKRLRTSLTIVEETFRDMDVQIVSPQAGLFCWLSFRSYMKSQTAEEEKELFNKIFNEGKTYIVPGGEFGCDRPGWFRIIFSVNSSCLKIGLQRIRSILLDNK